MAVEIDRYTSLECSYRTGRRRLNDLKVQHVSMEQSCRGHEIGVSLYLIQDSPAQVTLLERLLFKIDVGIRNEIELDGNHGASGHDL